MYKKPTQPKATEKTVSNRVRNVREVESHLIDFESWLDAELAKLEAEYESFSTATSNRKFFQR